MKRTKRKIPSEQPGRQRSKASGCAPAKEAKAPLSASLRQRAEERFRRQPTERKPGADEHQLVHKLQVHQIELEMQNEELRASEARLEAALSDYTELYDFAPAGYLTLARDSTIRQANLTAASLLGIERSRLLNRRFTSLVAAESRPVFGALLARAFETEVSQSGEVRLLIEGKLPLTVHLQASVTGRDHECLVVLTELTAALRQSAAIVEASDDAIISKDLNGTILTWNRAAEDIFGYRAEEVIGRHVRLLIPQDLQADEVAILAKVRKGGHVRHYEAVRLKKDGSKLTVSLTISPVRDASGSVVGASKIARDITERKQAEEKLRESEAAARARADELATMLAATPAITFIAHDRDCQRMTSSRAALRLMRLPAGANTSKSAPPRERPETFRAMKDGRELRPEELPVQLAAATGQAVKDFELTIAFEDGTSRDIVGDAVPLFDDEGKVRGAVGAFLDVTERKRAEERVRMFSQEIIAAREQERKEVSSVLHHDLGSLTVGIAAHFDAIEEDLHSGKPGEALKWMKRTRKLFHESVARLKKLAVELRPPELDVLGLCAALRQHFAQATGRGAPRIHFRETLGRRRVPGNTATILFRVAQEALTNALKHSRAKQVNVDLRASKEEVTLTVRDNGRGFDTSRARPRATSQIGLRVMQEMAASAGGTFTIDSRRRKRTTLRVRLPLKISP